VLLSKKTWRGYVCKKASKRKIFIRKSVIEKFLDGKSRQKFLTNQNYNLKFTKLYPNLILKKLLINVISHSTQPNFHCLEIKGMTKTEKPRHSKNKIHRFFVSFSFNWPKASNTGSIVFPGVAIYQLCGSWKCSLSCFKAIFGWNLHSIEFAL
jgi:hypothetical protein